MGIVKIEVQTYDLKHPKHPYGYGMYRGGWTVGSFMPYYNEIKVYGTIHYSDGSVASGIELLKPGYISLECRVDVSDPHITMSVDDISDNKIHGVVMDDRLDNIVDYKTGLEGLTVSEIDRLFPETTTAATYLLEVRPDPKVVGLVNYIKEFPIHILRFGEAVASAMWIGYFNKLRELASKRFLSEDERILLDSVGYVDPDTGFILTPRTPRWAIIKFIKEKYGDSSTLFLDKVKKIDEKEEV